MAARKRKITLSDEWKDKIKAGVIMSRLLGHVNGEVEMSATQIKAADILLKKIVPDVARTEVTGADGGPMNAVVSFSVVGVAPNGKPAS